MHIFFFFFAIVPLIKNVGLLEQGNELQFYICFIQVAASKVKNISIKCSEFTALAGKPSSCYYQKIQFGGAN